VKRKVIIDCDPGIGISGIDADDPLALCLAIAGSAFDLVGVTTIFGNVSNDIATRGAIKVLMELERTDIPVARGMSLPISGTHPAGIERAYKEERGKEGIIPLPSIEGNISEMDAVDFIISMVKRYPGEIDIIPIGPQTNIAMALLKDPSIAKDIGEIVFMGGAMGVEPTYGKGNVTTVAELNIWHDPLAAQIVFSSGIPVTMVGLDITNPAKKTVMYEDTILKMKSSTRRSGKFLYDVCKVYMESPMFHKGAQRGCIMYDPMAVAAYIDRSLVSTESMKVVVELNGTYTTGQTLSLYAPEKERLMSVCTDVDGERAIDYMTEKLLSLC